MRSEKRSKRCTSLYEDSWRRIGLCRLLFNFSSDTPGELMTFSYHRSYTGNVQGVVLDWSGTTLDYGCFAPTVVFVQLFKEQGVEITMDQARKPMGAYKRDHIAQIMAMPEVAVRWESV